MKGNQFKIIDSAHFPEKPFEPDFKKIIALAIGIGLSMGGAIALSLEYVSTSFKDPNELEKFLNIQVVCAIPVIRTKKEIAHEKIRRVSLDLALCLAAARNSWHGGVSVETGNDYHLGVYRWARYPGH